MTLRIRYNDGAHRTDIMKIVKVDSMEEAQKFVNKFITGKRVLKSTTLNNRPF